MRSRFPRRFRPLADSLERLATVSSLVSGLPITFGEVALASLCGESSAIGGERESIKSEYETVAPPLLTLSANLSHVSEPTTVLDGGWSVTVSASDSTLTTQLVSMQSLSADIRAIQASTLPSVAETSAVTPQAQSVALPYDGVPALSINSNSDIGPLGSLSAVSSPAKRISDSTLQAGDIRPMTLAPSTSSDADASSFSVMGASGGSGGGGNPPPPDMPPIISGGAGSSVGATVNGTGNIPQTIPVGSNAGFLVSSPGAGYVIDTVQTQWMGGTNYKSYTSQPASNAPPNQMSVQTGVNTNNGYTFIVDATPRTYSIKASVVYTNGAKGSSILTFTSDKPNYSLSNPSPGFVSTQFTVNNFGQDNGVYMGFVYLPGIDNRIKFHADTSYEPESQMIGNFMFLQLINFNNTVVLSDPGNRQNASGITLVQTSSSNYVIDDGFDSLAAIGQPLLNGGTSWQNIQFGSSFGTMIDKPSLTLNELDSGGLSALYHKSASLNMSFKTYLMYMPPSGVWIALSEYDWNFSITISNSLFPSTSNYNWAPGPITQPAPVQSTPSGSDAFPSWYDDAYSLRGFDAP